MMAGAFFKPEVTGFFVYFLTLASEIRMIGLYLLVF